MARYLTLATACIALSLGGCALAPGRVTRLVGNPNTKPIVIQTTDGQVRGVAAPQGEAFLDVPFAAPPVGPHRFAPPGPVTPWSGIRDAAKPGDNCMQAYIPGEGPQSEDCLNLNIYAPHDADPAKPKPVMVWIYGGAFSIGDNVQYDPSALAEKQGVIVVSPNYRLGALGFLAHPALRGSGEGGYAVQDQQAALRWVRDNIARFGGDPHNVTLFGESAGGWSVCSQLTAPGAKGLFQHAIIESGACTSLDSAIPLAAAEAGGEHMAADLGCSDLATAADCLRRLPAQALIKAKPERRGLMGVQSWAPAYGGDVLPQRPLVAFQSGDFAVMPVIDGTNRDEGRLFLHVNRWKGLLWTRASYEKIIRDFFDDETPKVLAEYEPEAKVSMAMAYADVVTDSTFSCPALALNALLEKKTSVYAYEFADPHAITTIPNPPFTPPIKAYHGSELVYVFQTPWAIASPKAFDGPQRTLSDTIQTYWASFARTGAPVSQGAADWPMDHGQGPLRLAPAETALAADYATTHRCAFWSTIRY